PVHYYHFALPGHIGAGDHVDGGFGDRDEIVQAAEEVFERGARVQVALAENRVCASDGIAWVGFLADIGLSTTDTVCGSPQYRWDAVSVGRRCVHNAVYA